MNVYQDIFHALNAADIRYLVVGGVAVNLHGYSRFTGDVDILLALDAPNVDHLAALMARRGYVQRLPVDVRRLSDREQVRAWMTVKGMTAFTFIDPKLPQLSLDILTADSLDFDAFDGRKVIIEAGEVPIPVVSIDDLIDMKMKVNRQKDAEDIAALLALKDI